MGVDFMASWAKSLAFKQKMASLITILGYSNQSQVESLLKRNDENFKKNWSMTLANTGKYTVDQISTWVGAQASTVRDNHLGEQYLKNWASNLADGGSSIKDIAAVLGNDITTANVRDKYLGKDKTFRCSSVRSPLFRQKRPLYKKMSTG